MSWCEMRFYCFWFPNISENKLSRRDKRLQARNDGGFSLLLVFRAVVVITGTGRQPPIGDVWIHRRTFNRHVNNCRRLQHFGADGNVEGYEGRSVNMTWIAVVCALSFSSTKRSRPFFLSLRFHLFPLNSSGEGDFDCGWQLDLVAQILSRLPYVTVFHWQIYFVPLNVSEGRFPRNDNFRLFVCSVWQCIEKRTNQMLLCSSLWSSFLQTGCVLFLVLVCLFKLGLCHSTELRLS